MLITVFTETCQQSVSKNPHTTELHVKFLNVVIFHLKRALELKVADQSLVTHFCSSNIFTATINIWKTSKF
jgi:hypothetical protein